MDYDGGVDLRWTFTMYDESFGRVCRVTLVRVAFSCREPLVLT